MKKQFKFLLVTIALIGGFSFVIFMINQINGVFQLASGVNPLFGQIVLWGLIALTGIIIFIPFFIYLRFPKTLDPSEASRDLASYQKKLVERLQKNKTLKAKDQLPATTQDLPTAIAVLDEVADTEIKRMAATVFLTTAISQNGKLDALTVLATQSKMVWKVAHIYYQRPSLTDLTRLYGQVAMATFLASEIEDLDISEHFQPVIQAMMKNTAGKSLPIVGSTANIVMDSLLEGTTNAFLTLRVGIIAKRYCGSTESFDLRKTRKRAYLEASEMLGKIVLQSSGKVISSVLKATKNVGIDTFKSGVETVKNAGEKVKDTLINASRNLVKKKESTVEE